jgi:alanine-synthesizing transaminase
MARVKENLAELDRQLARQNSCSGLEVEGGWNAVIRVPATRSDEDLALELLAAKGVYVHPGHFYDFPAEGFVVVSLLSPIGEFAQGIRELLSTF